MRQVRDSSGESSTIRTAGEAILVDFQPVADPYQVSAIGSRDTLSQRFLADPEVQAALEAAKVPELGVPTVAEGEGWKGLLAAELRDPEEMAVIGGGFELLDQLALEHLYGVR